MSSICKCFGEFVSHLVRCLDMDNCYLAPVHNLLDIKIFDVLRAKEWWKAPVASSLLASTVDTYIFFSIAFLGSGLPWVTWAVGDLCVKVSMVGLLLYPFRMLTWRGRDISRSCSVDSTSQSGQL